MGILLAALAGAGNSAIDSMKMQEDQQFKLDAQNQQNASSLRNQLALDKQRFLLERQKEDYLENIVVEWTAPAQRLGMRLVSKCH